MIDINENTINTEKLDSIRFIMKNCVECEYIKIVEDNNDGSFTVFFNGEIVTITFDLSEPTAKYVYDINEKGPYVHDSYEYIRGDIMDYIDFDLDNMVNELLTIKEYNI